MAFTDINTYDCTGYNLQQITALDSNAILNPSKPFKKYISMRALAKSQKQAWENCADYTSLSFNKLSKGSYNMAFSMENAPTL